MGAAAPCRRREAKPTAAQPRPRAPRSPRPAHRTPEPAPLPRCKDETGRRNPRRAPPTMTQKVAVLGTGKIGEALLSGMIRAGWATADLLVTTRRQERAEDLRTRYGVTPV